MTKTFDWKLSLQVDRAIAQAERAKTPIAKHVAARQKRRLEKRIPRGAE